MKPENGFTLLEILVVIMILGMLAAMAWPSIGIIDDAEKEKITMKKMDEIRDAVIGRPDFRDSDGNRIVGGFVGDMKRWPFLWEARAFVRPDYAGTGWDDPDAMTDHLGQFSGYDADGYPLYPIDSGYAIPKPDGRFEGEKWKWHRPFRKLAELSDSGIGDPVTENEGQPRELWTRFPEDLPFDLSPTHKAPGYALDERWKGPYIVPPDDKKNQDAEHYAVTDSDYTLLEPVWHFSGPHSNAETWPEGCYSPADGELGEKFDDKEKFRLLQTGERLADAWGRSFRFFITSDINNSGETLFWILSEGPDMEAVYPSRKICTGPVTDDVMGALYDPALPEADRKGYNPDLPENRDNIVMKLSSADWKTLFAEDKRRKEERTKALLEQLASAVAPSSSETANTGYTGEMLSWPGLYVWEGADWDDRNASNVPYVSGQPRGLWTDNPGSGDILSDSASGVGWRNMYFPEPPVKTGRDSVITDAWGQPFIFFRDDTGMMILSKGEDGKYTFGNPDDPAEAVILSSYSSSASGNADNLTRTVTLSSWVPGFFIHPGIRIYGFSTLDHTKLRIRLNGVVDSALVRKDPVLKAGTDGSLNDLDSDGTWDEWILGPGSDNAFLYDDTTAGRIVSGARYMAVWEDADSDDIFDSGEKGFYMIHEVRTSPAGMAVEELDINAYARFRVLP